MYDGRWRDLFGLPRTRGERRARPTTRNECGRVIAVGETYRHTSGLYEDSWNINKVCAHCTIAAKWLMENCHGYLDGMIEEDIEQHFDEYARVDLARLERSGCGGTGSD